MLAARFLAYGWEVMRVSDPNDIEHVDRALESFSGTSDRPTLIIVHSHIGYGAPHKQDTSEAHGEPLGEEEVRLTKAVLRLLARRMQVSSCPPGCTSTSPHGMGARGASCTPTGMRCSRDTRRKHPDLADIAANAQPRVAGGLGQRHCPLSRRMPKACQPRCLRQGAQRGRQEVPWLMGGSADLAPSTKTRLSSRGPATSRPTARAITPDATSILASANTRMGAI